MTGRRNDMTSDGCVSCCVCVCVFVSMCAQDYKPPTRKQRRPAPPHPPPAAPATQVAHRKRRPREPKAPHPSAEHLTPSVPRPRNTSVTDPAPATPRSHCTPPSQSAASASRHGSESAAAAAFTLDQLVNHPFRCLRCGTVSAEEADRSSPSRHERPKRQPTL